MAAIVAFVASFIYLVGFFGVDFVQSLILRPAGDVWTAVDEDDEVVVAGADHDKILLKEDSRSSPCGQALDCAPVVQKPKLVDSVVQDAPKEKVIEAVPSAMPEEDEEIIKSVVEGKMPSYSLEAKLGDCKRAAAIRREALQRMTGKSLSGLPLEGFDYESILGQCCEMPVGYVQLPVGIAGPLLLDGREYSVPMATTEGCLVASTNRGCKAIFVSGGATSVLLRDGMTRAPIVRFATAKRAADLKFFVENPANFESLARYFQQVQLIRKAPEHQVCDRGEESVHEVLLQHGRCDGHEHGLERSPNVLDFLQSDFPDMDVLGISGNFCADKKPAAVNWIEGRGKSVVCEATIKGDVVRKVLKTSVEALVELNMLKNLTGSAMAGALGGFNAHASNIVAAIFIATGQDPAQNVESSHCITMMEAINDGKDLHVSVTMPSIEVGTVGGGTQLASQSACLNLLGVKGANKELAGANSRLLATVVSGAVLAAELSLMSAIAAGQLVKSHMKYNRSSKDVTKVSS
uniref:3-hydroxy-3-methylglutaryl coenzyme A reductase n=1 Tax=Eucalyptus grandis x Eucalyptus urophylla TaxID=192399 RepID=D8VEB7_9MYRT|nr:3-hydroxy-3-methylglutaryl coenzyme A reductase [Eucalyptus grandis x Eucalyptus urophylla]